MNRPFALPMGVLIAERKRGEPSLDRPALEHGPAALEYTQPGMRLSEFLELVNSIEASDDVRFEGMIRGISGRAIGIKVRSGR